MKFAPVLSQKYDPASLSDYHLILAHEVVSDREYAEYYSNLGEEHTVILDNGTVENGSVQVGLVEEALKILNRKVICVAPDFLGDSINTLEASSEFLRKCDLDEDQIIDVPETYRQLLISGVLLGLTSRPKYKDQDLFTYNKEIFEREYINLKVQYDNLEPSYESRDMTYKY